MANLFQGTNNPHSIKMELFNQDKTPYDNTKKLKDLDFLNELTENKCEIDSPNRNIIANIALPIFIVLLFSLFFLSYKKVERIYYGKQGFEEIVDLFEKNYEKRYPTLSESWKETYDSYKPFFNREITYWDYLKAYYSGKFYQGTKNEIYFDIALLSMPLIGVILMGLIIFYLPWVVLNIDRNRQIFYVWNSQNLLVTRYCDAEYGYAGPLMRLKLYRIDKKTGELTADFFKPNISYSTSHLMIRESDNQRFISFINTFMKEGRDAISQTNYKRRMPLLWFNKNSLPADVDQQIERVLAAIDKEKAKENENIISHPIKG